MQQKFRQHNVSFDQLWFRRYLLRKGFIDQLRLKEDILLSAFNLAHAALPNWSNVSINLFYTTISIQEKWNTLDFWHMDAPETCEPLWNYKIKDKCFLKQIEKLSLKQLYCIIFEYTLLQDNLNDYEPKAEELVLCCLFMVAARQFHLKRLFSTSGCKWIGCWYSGLEIFYISNISDISNIRLYHDDISLGLIIADSQNGSIEIEETEDIAWGWFIAT